MRKWFLPTSVLMFILFLPVISSTALAVSPHAIGVDVIPPNPSPFQNITIVLSSFAANLDAVSITWIEDGKTITSEFGRKSFTTKTKAAGSETLVEARIALPDGEIIKRIILRPAVLVLLWQATDSYVPPFYKGKALPTADSEIRVVAMPEIISVGKKVDPKNMTYSWEQDYENAPGASGYGKNFYTYVADYLRDSAVIGVVASTLDQQNNSESNINIATNSPEILFYKIDPSLGVFWENALSNDYTILGEAVVVAAPYFISPKDWRRPELEFFWSINGRSVAVPSYSKNLLPVRAGAGSSGASSLRLRIEHMDRIFQTVDKTLNIQF